MLVLVILLEKLKTLDPINQYLCRDWSLTEDPLLPGDRARTLNSRPTKIAISRKKKTQGRRKPDHNSILMRREK
jgi:hypothetical protein